MNEYEVLKLIKNAEGMNSAPEMIETHISWIFLTDRFAYKMKKTVTFDFLDYSTYEQRLKGSQDEIRLNRRLAPKTYLGLVFITEDELGEIRLDGQGKKIEVLVKMKRLPAHLMLDKLIIEDKLSAAQLLDVSNVLTDFFSAQKPQISNPDEYVTNVKKHVRENRRVLLDKAYTHLHDIIRTTHTAQLQFLDFEAELLQERVQSGKIIEGHGDLRPEHICLLPDGAVVFDCIEFNREFRVIDIIDELSFLAVECEHLGNEECGNFVLHEYKDNCSDQPDSRLIEFYKSYRASVRAKVAAIRSKQCSIHELKHQNRLVDHYCNIAQRHGSRLESQFVFIIGGGMGTGKTTLAKALAKKYGTAELHTDSIRNDIFEANSDSHPFSTGKYSTKNRQYVYDKLILELEDLVQRGLSVVVDGSFQSEFERKRIQNLAEAYGCDFQIFWCECPKETARTRIAQRSLEGHDDSEARPELIEMQMQEGSTPNSLYPFCTAIDTTGSLTSEMEVIRKSLKSRFAHIKPHYPAQQKEPYALEYI